MQEPKATRVAAAILLGCFILEGAFALPPLIQTPHRFLLRLGFLPGPHSPTTLGWILGLLVAGVFILFSSRLPSVRANLIRPSWLKFITLGQALVTGILEEFFFRGIVMDWAQHQGWNAVVQVLLSGLIFGAAHALWALFRGSLSTGIGAAVVTGGLGSLLAIVYLAGDRSLAPCVTSHALINLLIEPGLVLAALRGEMRRGRRGVTLSS